MACLKYITLVIFLRCFDHSKMIPCVSMDSLMKNHVEIGKFPNGFCVILVRHGSYNNGLPIISYFSYFFIIF
jgi:hypothetical protein